MPIPLVPTPEPLSWRAPKSQLRNPDPLPTDGFYPTAAIRDVLRRGRKQLRGCKHLPTAILVFSDSMFRSVTTVSVAAAAFGPGYQQGRSYDPLSNVPQALRFPSKHECPGDHPELAHPFLLRTHNRSISAIMVLSRCFLDELQLVGWQAGRARGEQLSQEEHVQLASRRQDPKRNTCRPTATRVVVVENRHANIPFPDLFRGPFDQRWTWQEDWVTATWIGTGATQCLADGVPFDLL